VSPALVFDGFRAEAAAGFAVADPEAAARLLLDPACASETIHWGRNYLYRARIEALAGPIDVVVKQFRNASLGDRIRRRLSGDKAAKSWEMALALGAAGFETPEPLLRVEPVGGGPSLFVTRYLPGRTELRYWLRARNAGTERERFPAVDADGLIAAVARLARRLHDAGFWFRDFSVGNLLVDLADAGPGAEPRIALVDLNRCRRLPRVPAGARLRDLARLPFERRDDRERLLSDYFAPAPVPPGARPRYALARIAFHGRHRVKNRVRGAAGRLRAWVIPRGTHAHIPPPPAAAGKRDRVVWDALSDQPHQHAGRLDRLWVRVADLPDHLKSASAALFAAPRIARSYRRLARERGAHPFPWPGAGVALRPHPADPAALLAAFDALGVGRALLRLHPWEEESTAEEELARELAERGVDLVFALPQNRALVADPAGWRRAVERLAERFAPYGRTFQVGQAINRSKWGVWNYGEYLELAASAAEILRRRRADVELVGPGVIDFELHATAAVVNRRHPTLRFDALASLLYVDRRGAPESRQLGFDTADKVTLAAAVAATARRVAGGRSWVTEVNWPLAEGPHSPAGRAVAVDEETQADYLARFYLEAGATGLVERIYWWQLVARGYGLATPDPAGGLRLRPAHAALATLERELAGSTCLGRRAAPSGARWIAFRRPDGAELWAGWSVGGGVAAALPRPAARVSGRGGEALPVPPTPQVELHPAVRYFELVDGG